MSADVTTPLPEQEAFARSLATELAGLCTVAEESMGAFAALGSDQTLERTGLLALSPAIEAEQVAHLLAYQIQALLRFGIEHTVGVVYTLPSARPLVPQPSSRAASEAFACLFELVDPTAPPAEKARRALNRRIVSLTEQHNALGEPGFIAEIEDVHAAARALGLGPVPADATPVRFHPPTIGRRSTSARLVERAVASVAPANAALGRLTYQRSSATVHSQDHGINESSHIEVDGEFEQLPLTHVYPSRISMVTDVFMPAMTAYGAMLPFCDQFELDVSIRGRLIDVMQPILARIGTDPALLAFDG